MERIQVSDFQPLVTAQSGQALFPPRPGRCICKGAGFLSVDTGDGSFEIVPCICRQKKEQEAACRQLRELSGLGGVAEKTFASFDERQPGCDRAAARARHYAEEPRGWLVLRGPVGTGKTHLAAAVVNVVAARGVPACFFVVADLLDLLRAAYDPEADCPGYDRLMTLVKTAPLLVLDDLGAEKATDWAREKVYQIVDYRYRNRLPTVITTNARADTLDERVESRMLDRALTTLIVLETADYRRRKGA